jgi:hypothetical protein
MRLGALLARRAACGMPSDRRRTGTVPQAGGTEAIDNSAATP